MFFNHMGVRVEFLNQKQDEILNGIQAFFAAQIRENPEYTKKQVERELESLYVRFGNDWTWRSIVGDTTQMATNAGLEAVRAECLANSDIKDLWLNWS